jgi:hypothetical protein
MSQPARDTRRPFQPPVAQRDIKAEVIHCVGGVTASVLLPAQHRMIVIHAIETLVMN